MRLRRLGIALAVLAIASTWAPTASQAVSTIDAQGDSVGSIDISYADVFWNNSRWPAPQSFWFAVSTYDKWTVKTLDEAGKGFVFTVRIGGHNPSWRGVTVRPRPDGRLHAIVRNGRGEILSRARVVSSHKSINVYLTKAQLHMSSNARARWHVGFFRTNSRYPRLSPLDMAPDQGWLKVD